MQFLCKMYDTCMFDLGLIYLRCPSEARAYSKLSLSSLHPLICSSCPVISEGVLWQEANALQFPELLAKATCSLCQGHLQTGNFLFLV